MIEGAGHGNRVWGRSLAVHPRLVRRLLSAGLLVAVLASGCAGGAPATQQPSPGPTSCGGNRIWPPPYYPGSTDAVKIALVDSRTVRVTNESDATWTAHVAPWVLAACVGWIALGNTEGARFLLLPGASHERDVAFDPGYESQAIGVGLWDHECLDPCTDELTAFNSLPLAGP